MKRYNIRHLTEYQFEDIVELKDHILRLRPREGHELRIENSSLNITPIANIRWYRDPEDNSVATISFSEKTDNLSIESNIIIQQYDQAPYDFLVSDYAKFYPFLYQHEDAILLSAYMEAVIVENTLDIWINRFWQPGEQIESYVLLERLNKHIFNTIQYCVRDEPGVQTPIETITLGSGSCRDSASLFLKAAKKLGFAARFVSGYVRTPAFLKVGSTHAWAEVFLPGAGWKGFDPSTGKLVGAEHIPVAVVRSPEAAPPVSGAYVGYAKATMSVGVWVTEIS